MIPVTAYALLACAVSAFPFASVCAEDIGIGGGSGIRVELIRHQDNPLTPYAGSTWNVRINRSAAVLHWVASSFVHTEATHIETDAILSAVVKKQVGAINIATQQSIDRTNISADDRNAAVTMVAQGAGIATIELQIGIEDTHACAGRHSTTVVLNVTAP